MTTSSGPKSKVVASVDVALALAKQNLLRSRTAGSRNNNNSPIIVAVGGFGLGGNPETLIDAISLAK
jgi:acyl CoA:acetate/3-ketoacid CoA transferase alpha subunit